MQRPERTTRAFEITPVFAQGEQHAIKKELLLIVARHSISNLAAKVVKLDRQHRTLLLLQSSDMPKIERYLRHLDGDHPTWVRQERPATNEERDEFTGRRIIPSPEAISGGPDSSGFEAHDAQSSIDSSVTASASMVARLEAAEARAQAEAEARAQAEEARAQAEAARVRAEEARAQAEAARERLIEALVNQGMQREEAENIARGFS